MLRQNPVDTVRTGCRCICVIEVFINKISSFNVVEICLYSSRCIMNKKEFGFLQKKINTPHPEHYQTVVC